MAKTCFHCGSPSGSWVRHDDKDFCCEGCVMVYDILKENKMDTYYDINASPGIRKKAVNPEYYDYLDQEEIKQSVLDFRDGHMARVRLYLPSIHCSSCIWLIENLHRLHPGVLHSTVNFNRREAAITFDESQLKLSALMTLLSSINYKPHIQKEQAEKTTQQSRKLITKLGVAGFVFGNVMLLSFPDYLSPDVALHPELIGTFKWISLFLCIPVMVYSGNDYFITAWKNLRKRIISIDLPIAVGILAIFLRSVYELVTSIGPGYFDSLTGLVFFLLIGKWYQAKTYEALSFDNDYSAYFPLGITRIENNTEVIVPIHQLKKGDRISVRNGEIIPADAKLQSLSASIDYSFITGESVPVRKQKEELVYAGGRVMGSAILLQVEKEVETGYLAGLWKEKKKEEGEESMISHTLNVVSKYFTIVILLISLMTALFWLWQDPSKAILAFTSVLIIACPCALALSVPFAFGHAARIMGKNHFYLKLSSVIEALSKITTVVFDKTGTLTDPDLFDVQFEGHPQDHYNYSLIKSLAHQSRHPLSRALYSHLAKYDEMEVFDFKEQEGLGVEGIIMNQHVKMGSAAFVGLTDVGAQEAARVHVSLNAEYQGYFTIRNFYRPNWQQLLRLIQAAGDVHLLSGDNDAEKDVLKAIITNETHLRFYQSPKDKLAYIQELNRQHQQVMMVGDGLNDVGALKEAKIGIAVADDVYQFSPSSDAIISADALVKLPLFMRFAKSALRVVYAAIGISFLYNVVGLYFAVTGQLSPLFAAILMPLSSASVVVFTSLMVMGAAKRQGLL